ncbi:MAG TPA: hypothetical protein VK658_04560 [Chryseolinea sp.]|nr:hypothetical protein [Chryseolinea sp.]
MTDSFLRSTGKISLLEMKPKNSIRIINNDLSKFLENRDYRKRCLDNIEPGKTELNKMLTEAKGTILFNTEELVNWLYKIKMDAESETHRMFIAYDATLGMDEHKIDFERAGILSGMYMEADRWLDTLTAIEPLDKNKPQYAILDRLELLDEHYVKVGMIPGYYAFQEDSKIKKHDYAIKNLDDYWREHLAMKDKYPVGLNFGDTRHLLAQYHFEFRFEMVKIRPREEINLFLDYHFAAYAGEKIDFLNHIEFRVTPEISSVAGSNYPVYQLLIKEWLKDKRHQLNRAGEQYLVDSIVGVCASFIDHVFEHRKMSDENKYNAIICTGLNHRFSFRSWTAKDQSMGGLTDSSSRAHSAGVAFRDLIISNERNDHISAVECFRLYYVPSGVEGDSVIKEHLTKIFRNEPIGVSPLFIVAYCETKTFGDTWKKYLDYVEQIHFKAYPLQTIDKEFSIAPFRANIKVAKAEHIRETNTINVYHIFLNLYP